MSDRDDRRHDGENAPDAPDAPDAPTSADERRRAERLRDVLEGPARLCDALEPPPGTGAEADAAAIVAALRAAWSPRPLGDEAHAELLEDVPTPEERARADALREALARPEQPGSAPYPAIDLAIALRSVSRPGSLDASEHRAILARALDGRAEVVRLGSRGPRARVVAIATGLALAASVVFWMTTTSNGPPGEARLAKARSTQPLFGEPFKRGEASARIDRIVLARASDYRDNRFAAWGVR